MNADLLEDIAQVLFTENEIASVVAELGGRITADYSGSQPLVISVLKGGVVFLADLIRRIDVPLAVDFLAVSSYGPEATGGVVQLLKDLDELITGRDVIVVEDVIDTGLTLNYLLQLLKAREPASLQICALLDKSVRRIVDIPIAYKGFDLPDLFVVGYGLDFAGLYRNLPFIGILTEEKVSPS